jgi:large subunit ribosomal protein L10
MPRTEKLERVAELKQRIEGANALLLTEYRGLTVSEIAALRRSLRDADASFAVVKNTLMLRAAAEAGLELADLLRGPSAVAFVGGDAVTAAKQIKAATKQFPALVLKGGFMDGQVLSADEANRLADLESRDVMLSKIAGLFKGEMSRAASMFASVPSRFLSLLEAYRETVPGEPTTGGDDSATAEDETEDGTEAAGTVVPESVEDAEQTSEEGRAAPSDEAASDDGDEGKG